MLHGYKMRAELTLFEARFSPLFIWNANSFLNTTNEMRLLDNGSTGYLNATISETGMK